MSDKKKVYISLPINDKDKDRQRARAAELAHRIRSAGYEAVNPFDIGDDLDAKFAVAGGKPDKYDYMAENFHALLQSDGILCDIDAKTSLECNVELAVDQSLAASRSRHFTIFHTKEQWKEVNNRYII